MKSHHTLSASNTESSRLSLQITTVSLPPAHVRISPIEPRICSILRDRAASFLETYNASSKYMVQRQRFSRSKIYPVCDVAMLRSPVHRYRHRNTSLPEEMRSTAAFITREMVFPTREGATFGWSTEVTPPDYPGRIGYFSTSSDLTTDGSPRSKDVADSSGSSTSSGASIVMITENVQTVTAGSITAQSLDESLSTTIAAPLSGGVPETLSTPSVSSSTVTNAVNEGRKIPGQMVHTDNCNRHSNNIKPAVHHHRVSPATSVHWRF